MGKCSIIIGALLWFYRPFELSMQKSLNCVNLLHVFHAPTMTNNVPLLSVLQTSWNWPKSEICALVEDSPCLDIVLSVLCCKVYNKKVPVNNVSSLRSNPGSAWKTQDGKSPQAVGQTQHDSNLATVNQGAALSFMSQGKYLHIMSCVIDTCCSVYFG